MLDLETLGLKPGYIILQIGACTFDCKHTFKTGISVNSSMYHGFKKNLDTEEFWLRQDKELYKEVTSSDVVVTEALDNFEAWFNSLGQKEHLNVWSKGGDFDIPILEEYYNKLERNAPWFYRNKNCFRTLFNLFPNVPAVTENTKKHDALADAIYQAKHATNILSYYDKLLTGVV